MIFVIQYLKLYFITLIIFFLVDMIWLGLVAKNFYQDQLGFILSKNPNWLVAIIFYLIFIFGVVYFVILPSLDSSWIIVFINGSLFGFITYATYDLTNLATIQGWPLKVTIIDLIWGTALGGIVSTISFLINK